MKIPSIVVGLLSQIAISAAAAQSPARYVSARDTLRYEIDNPFRMYWVHGTDTVGLPQHAREIETHVWRGTAARPEVIIRQLSLNVGRRTLTDTFTVAPNGRVAEINHRPPLSGKRIDLLLHLPSSSLAVGTRWTDTVRATGTDPGGAQWYDVVREYRVVRLVDTLGTRGAADVSAQGTIRMRFGFWIDSAAGKAAWIDVAGPVREKYLFDVAQGRLVRREWTMDLRGRGVGPTSADTVVAGLRSDEVLALTNSPWARFLLTALPGADTSVTVDMDKGGAILLHTIVREPNRITSALARNDGMVGVATSTFSGVRPGAFEATWAGATGTLEQRRVSVRADSLVLARAGKPDTALALPEAVWGIADHGMPELLAPMLLAIPRNQQPHRVDVLRPYSGEWDTGVAMAREQAGLVMVVLNFVEDEDFHVFVFTPEGDLLFDEGTGKSKSRRVPTDAARLKVFEAAVKSLSGGKP